MTDTPPRTNGMVCSCEGCRRIGAGRCERQAVAIAVWWIQRGILGRIAGLDRAVRS